MGKAIAVFNTKGGVGKSTTVMMLAEAMSAFDNKRILVIDADPQTSVSVMMTPKHEGVPDHLREKCWDWAERNKRTIVDFFTQSWDDAPAISDYRIGAVSDVQGANTIDLMPGNMQLALFESDKIMEDCGHQKLDKTVRSLLQSARAVYDVVLIDCPPGITPLTMLWLEHSDAFLPPTTPNYLGIRGLRVTTDLRERFEQRGRKFPRRLGTLITLDSNAPREQKRKQEIMARDTADGIAPFSRQIPRLQTLQNAAEYHPNMRTFSQKYPNTGNHNLPRIIKDLAREVTQRIA